MQVSEHVVSLYIATCGQNGPGLGSDEKEIILLVYVLLEAATGQIIGTKQILVRPDGHLIKDRSISISSDVSNTNSTSAASPPLAITAYGEVGNTNATNNNSINNITNVNNNNNSITTTNYNNINNNNNNMITNGLCNNNNNSIITTTTLTALDNNNIELLPIAEAQAAGKPLNEAIEEFDAYLRSLSLNDLDNIKLITDGQLPLRQCLHPEACSKDIELPAYYNKFCDLRKEFLRYKSGDLSRALVPVKDIKKMLQIPTLPLPQSIGEMLKELNLTSVEDSDFLIRESRDMVTVIQTLLKSGHKFAANEIVNLVLEPGICSIDDEIDGNCVVRARGLPWQSSDQDIAKFFRGLNVAKGGVALCLSPLGRRNGEALIRFVSQEHRDMALKRHKHHIGSRYIEVYRATGEDFLAIAGGASNEAQAFLSKGAQVIIRMRGLPYDCTAKQVLDFFTTGENPCNVLDGTEGVLFVKKPDGRATGDAFVLFANETDAPKALGRHRESIGQRYIELFRSTTAEVQQVLNRSMDPKTYEPNNHSQPPLIPQLPTIQMPLLPQQLITSGSEKKCIRLRGLPYEAMVQHILHFLDDFAKNIIYQGVHMVINAQGQPSGEAFIQMDSEESARLCAQRKHNQYMVFGKKFRYIEVFQCSGDDMNMVLNGGLQSPVTPHHSPHSVAIAAAAAAAAGKQQSALLSPGASVIGAQFAPFTPFAPQIFTTGTHRAHHPHAHGHHAGPAAAAAAAHHNAHATHATAAAFYTHHPLVYWPYPSPPVSPTPYFSQPGHSPPHVPGNLPAQHQAMYSLDFLPTNFAPPQGSPLSPPSVAIPHTNAGLLLSSNSKAPAMTFVPPKQFQTHSTHSSNSHNTTSSSSNNKLVLTSSPTTPSTTVNNFIQQPTTTTATPVPVTVMSTTLAAAAPPPTAVLAAVTQTVAPVTQTTLLSIDTSQCVERATTTTNVAAMC